MRDVLVMPRNRREIADTLRTLARFIEQDSLSPVPTSSATPCHPDGKPRTRREIIDAIRKLGDDILEPEPEREMDTFGGFRPRQ